MTIRTFWTIFIKILGIWLVLDGITVIPQYLSVVSASLFYSDSYETTENFALTFSMLLLTGLIYIFILRMFVFKTDWLIDKLQLDKGFSEEKIELNVHGQTVLTIATIVTGGLILVDSLPDLCRQVFVFFQQKAMFRENPSSGGIIFQLAKTVVGYLLMTNSQAVVKFIDRQVAKPNDTNQ